MKPLIVVLAVQFGALALTNSTRTAGADAVVVSPPTVVRDETVTSRPNPSLLRSGIWLLGLSYVPAVIVAAESDRHGDKRLYIPVVGPWLGFTSRSHCPANVACSNETRNQARIVVVGAFQGLEVFNTVGTFIFPKTRTVSVSSSGNTQASGLSFHIFPAKVGGSAYGLAAAVAF